MAHNVRATQIGSLDESIVRDGRLPANAISRRIARLETRDSLAIDGDLRDVTVGGDESRGSCESRKEERSWDLERRHLGTWNLVSSFGKKLLE